MQERSNTDRVVEKKNKIKGPVLQGNQTGLVHNFVYTLKFKMAFKPDYS